MKVKICPGCGRHNSIHALRCLACGRTLSVKTIVDLDAEAPEEGETREKPAGVSMVSGAWLSTRQPVGPDVAATPCSGHTSRPVEPRMYAPAAARERGGCLSLWLVGVMGANLIGMVLLLAAGTFDCIVCGLSVANVVCAVALWNWKKWGAYGLAASFSLVFVLGLAIQDLYTIAASILPMILLFALVKPKWGILE